jgi:septal ring factor EnvC (AmiA/AmiB activator)
MDAVLLLDSEREPRPGRREVLGMDEPTQVQIARLASDVKHIEAVVSDTRIDVRRIDERLKSIDERVHQLDSRVYQVEQRLTEKIASLRAEMNEKFVALQSELHSAKVWALGLYIAQGGGLLLVMAKGFKWI